MQPSKAQRLHTTTVVRLLTATAMSHCDGSVGNEPPRQARVEAQIDKISPAACMSIYTCQITSGVSLGEWYGSL
jgi:hypothetical protein